MFVRYFATLTNYNYPLPAHGSHLAPINNTIPFHAQHSSHTHYTFWDGLLNTRLVPHISWLLSVVCINECL